MEFKGFMREYLPNRQTAFIQGLPYALQTQDGNDHVDGYHESYYVLDFKFRMIIRNVSSIHSTEYLKFQIRSGRRSYSPRAQSLT